MTGSLINLVSKGDDDMILTHDPQITFFKLLYKRHTKFAMEYIKLPINNMNFGLETNIELPRYADLINDIYIEIDIPSIHLLKENVINPITDSDYIITQYTDLDGLDTDYMIINNMMLLNSTGYRTAVKNKNILNQTTYSYIQTILTSIQTAITDNNFENVPNEYKIILDTEKEISPTLVYLYYENSDIQYILNNITDVEVFDTLTSSHVFTIIENAINISVQVKTYFFNKLNNKINSNLSLSSSYAKFAWVEKLGHAIIDNVSVYVGGQLIDRHYGNWIDVKTQLTHNLQLQQLYNEMIGNVLSMTTFNNNEKPKYKLIIPLLFWFNTNINNSLPIISLQYSSLSLNLKFRSIEDCAYVEKLTSNNTLLLSDIWEKSNYSLSGNLIVNYIYLNSDERSRFAQVGHEYLIETITPITIHYNEQLQNIIDLDYFGPSKELIYFVQKSAYIHNNSNSSTKNLWFNYTTNNLINPINKSLLTINGLTLFDFTNMTSNIVQTNHFHTQSPLSGINVISFSLFPEEIQPSGSCNFSRLRNIHLTLDVNNLMLTYNTSEINQFPSTDELTTFNITIYSVIYNVLRFYNGTCSLAFNSI